MGSNEYLGWKSFLIWGKRLKWGERYRWGTINVNHKHELLFHCDHSDAFYLFWLLKRSLSFGAIYTSVTCLIFYTKLWEGSLVMTPWYFNCRNPLFQTSLVVQWFSLHDSTAGVTDSIPGWWINIKLSEWHGQNKKRKETHFSKHCTVLSLRMFLENDCLHVSNIVLFVRFSTTQKLGK